MFIRSTTFVVLAFAIVLLPAQGAEGPGFRPLFDGHTLEGWLQRGGQATFDVVDETIVGKSAPNTSNTFLCTKRTFGDFTLTYEFLCDKELNSGVQIRSECYDQPVLVKIKGEENKIPAGRVHGYQVEIDPNKADRMWTAGIYDEARRGWLYPGPAGGNAVAFTEQGKRLYKPEQWNQVRVVCRGDHIRTWLNGEPRADFHDETTASGFIALQVHSVGDRQDSLSVQWRNIQIWEH